MNLMRWKQKPLGLLVVAKAAALFCGAQGLQESLP